MELTFRTALALFGGTGAIIIAASGFLTNLLNQRLLSKWRRDEQTSVEAFRHTLANERVVLESAIRGSQQGLDKGHEKKLAAIDQLWSGVLKLREASSVVCLFFNIFLPEEYDLALQPNRGGIASEIRRVDDDFVTSLAATVGEVEAVRPYLGELLWLRFFIYRAFICRLAVLVSGGRERRHIDDWRKDHGIQQILAAVMKSETAGKLFGDPKDISGVMRVTQHLEFLILEEVSITLSGKRSAQESFENAKELSKHVAALSPSQRQ